MEPTFLHSLFNHLPVIGTAIGFVIVGASFFVRNVAVRNVGLIVFAFMALAVIPASKTGELAEERVEEISNVDHNVIHEHEEMAEVVMPLALVGAALALLILFYDKKLGKASQMVLVSFMVVAALEVAQAIRAGHQGAKIRRIELQQDIPIGHPHE